ncbi:VCBS repeat-containing protein [Mycobacterium sp. MAA66]|uniref:Ig-like domain-containing protein n=1 Tax=Mycobacterium sp. MAA66 TaxID=3156297 RepID=UPI003512F7F6
MSGAHQSNSRSKSTSRKKGSHRVAPKPSRQPYNWLGVGAVTLGLGAAMASGTGIAEAKGGTGNSGSSSSSSPNHNPANNPANGSADNNSSSTDTLITTGSSTNASGSSTDNSSKGHKHQKDKAAANAGASSDSNNGTDTSGSSTDNGTNSSPGKGKKAAATTKPKPKQTATAATAVTATNTAEAPAATAAAAPAATTPTAATAKAVALAAAAPAATTKAVAVAATAVPATPHATSTNPIVAAIQNAMIGFFTAASTITQLTANHLTGPLAPAGDPVAGFLYGIFRGMEDFAGLVPRVGTPTTTSNPVNGTVTGNLNFTEPAGAQLTYSVYTNPAFGTVTVNTDGTYAYKSNIFGAALAALGLNPTDSFTVTATDGVASTNETVNVPVLSANNTPSTPVATNINENTATGVVTGTLSSTSPDGTAISYHVVTSTIGGSLSVNSTTGTFTYTPTAAYRQNANLGVITTDTFTVTASNASGGTSLSGFITVPVSPASNDTPSSPTAINVNANPVTGAVTGTISSTDPAGSTLTYSATQPVQGSITVNSTTGAFTYTPTALARSTANLGVITTDTFSVTATNTAGYSATSLITVPVEPANGDTPSTPTVTNQSVNTTTGVVTGTLSSTSPDGATVTFHVTAFPTQGTVTVNGSTFTFTPSQLAMNEASLGILTSDTFSVTASNGSYTSAIGYVTVPVNPIADTPSIPAATGVSANPVTGAVTGTIVSTDPANQSLTYTVAVGPIGGSVTLNSTTGAFTYNPTAANRADANLGVITTDTFTVTASNGKYSSNALITVPVEPSANDTPSTPTSSSLNVNTTTGVVTGTIDSTSPDGGALTYHVTALPTQGTITVSGNTYTYTPSDLARSESAMGIITTDVFSVTATNAAGYTSGIGYITVPVASSSDNPTAPVVTNQTQNLVTGVVSGTITSIDPANQPLTYGVSIGPIGGNVSLNSTTGAFTYTPAQSNRQDANLGVIETDSFTVTATNGKYTSSSIVTVPVSPASNDTPSTPAATGVVADPIGGNVTGTIVSTDPGNQPLSYSVTIGPIGGNVSLNSSTGAFTYTPAQSNRQDANLGVITTDSFTVSASNGTYSSSAMITVPVEPAKNDTPSTPISNTQNQNIYTGVVTGTISSTSPDGGAVSYTITTPTIDGMALSTGSISINSSTGAYTYTPTGFARSNANLGVVTTDSFTVTATNAAGYSSSTSVTVPISPASNDTPSSPVSVGQSENIYTGVVTGTAKATSPDGGAVTYSITTPTIDGMALSTGSISINATTGAYTYNPTAFARTNANLGVITSDSFTVTATNANGYSNSASITVPISPASNNTPSAPTVTNEIQNKITGVVTGTFVSTSPDGSAVTYSFTNPVQGSLSIDANGNFTYTPTNLARSVANQGVITTDTFTVTASNSTSTSSASWVTVPVSPASNNTPGVPVASNISVNSTTGVVTGTLTSTSPDGSTVSYSTISLPTQGSISISGNTFTYVPTSLAQFESQITLLTTGKWATDTFGVTASNASFSSGTASVTVGISPVSDTPSNPVVSNIQQNTITGVVTGTLSANDPAGLALSYNVNTPPIGGSVTISGSTFTYTPTALERSIAISGVTTDTFTVSASNSYYTSGATFVTVPVSPASNDTPSAPSASNVHQNIYTGVVTGTLNSTSPDSTAVTYSIKTGTIDGMTLSTGSISISGNTFTYTPTAFARSDANLGVITSDTFLVTATNANGISSSNATITVPISPASNDTPSTPTATNVHENIYTGVVTGTLSSTSPDGAAVSYNVTTGTIDGMTLSTGSISISGNTFTYTPTNASRVNANLGVITSDTFLVTATNGNFSSSNATITVPISPASNNTPGAPSYSNSENLITGVVTGTLSSTSPDGSAVTYNVTTGPIGGSVSISGNTFIYTPTNAYRQNANLGVITTDTFTVTASNSMETSGPTFVTVPVSPASNDTPTKPAASGQNENLLSGVVTGQISSTSPDGGAVTYSVTTGTIDGMTLSTGSISVNSTTGAYTYTPTNAARTNANLGVITSDTFTVTATNAVGNSSSTTVTVPISPANNDKPSAVTVSGQVQNKSSGVVTGTLNATSPDGSAVSYSITTGTIGGMELSTGSVTLSTSNGVTTFTFAPTAIAMSDSSLLGPYTDYFTITVSNGVTSNSTNITVPILAKSLI